MLRTIILISAILLCLTNVYGQFKVGDNTLVVDSASVLELESTNKGFLPSRLTTAQRDAQTRWKLGHIIYNKTDSCLQLFNGTSWDCLIQGVLVDSTIYKYDGTLNSNRILSMNGFSLTFDGSGDIIILDDGSLGIGDLTPDAKLDVEGGTVRLSDYGTGSVTGSVSRFLGVDSDGDVIEIDTSVYDNQTIDAFSFDGTNLSLSLENDGQATLTVDLSSLQGTDDQVIDSFALVGTTLQLSLESDGEALKTVDLSSIDTKLTQEEVEDFTGAMVSGNTESGISVTYDDPTGKLNFDVNDPSISLTSDITGSATMTNLGNVAITTTITNDSVSNLKLANMAQNTFKGRVSSGSGDPEDLTVTQVRNMLGVTVDTSVYTFNGTLTGNRTIGLSTFDLIFDGTTDVVIQSDGDVGIGTTTPGAKLDVDNGTVRFSDYGAGTQKDTSSQYIATFLSNGDIRELKTAKNTRIFYPPGIIIDASSTTSSPATLDLYQEYVNQFSAPVVSSTGAPASIPTYERSDLYFYISFFDNTILDNVSIDANGVMTYDIISVPADNYTIINVVFVIK